MDTLRPHMKPTPPAWIVLIVVSGLVATTGCAPKAAPRRQEAASAASGAVASAPHPSTSAAHGWLYRDGQDYIYQALASDAGKPPAVQRYRYLGEQGGLFRLQVDGDVASCVNPCQVITLSTGPFHVERLAFDPDSLIGAAFQDAFDGQLQVYDPAKSR